MEFAGPVFEQWPPRSHTGILFESPLRQNDELAYATEVLGRFMNRAYRRPVSVEEVETIVRFFKTVRPDFPTFEGAMIEALSLVLIRPEFLYMMEPSGDEKRPVNQWELASRLSYFLWSTMPDSGLVELAEQQKLANPKIMVEQVQRMLEDPRSDRFFRQFSEQWLQLKNMESVSIHPKLYPDFDERLRDDMKRESISFLKEMIDQNLSPDLFLQSDFAMVNGRLASHYGLEGVTGETVQRVELPSGSYRGGLLGQASFLMANSTGADSHAIRRAVWIRDRILNDAPAPPPPDVPSLEESTPNFHELSVTQQLEIHRQKPSCANCHKNLDAWGVALENFDAVGKWRDEVRRLHRNQEVMLPVESKGELPEGIVLEDIADLQDHLLLNERDAFVQSLVVRLLTYAMGRRLERADQNAVSAISDQVLQKDLGMRDLINELVLSRPFNTK